LSFHEPKLCPGCPLSRKWKNEALRRIKQRQYTRAKTEPSALKICMERRKILQEQGLECPHFPKSEDITKFFGRVKKVNPLQLWHLRRFCDKHGLDYQLIDSTLEYEENKKHLASLVTDFKVENRLAKSLEEEYMTHHFLSDYVNCIIEGATKSEETGEPIQPSRFSLSDWINSHSFFRGENSDAHKV